MAPKPSVKSWCGPMTRCSWVAGADESLIRGPEERAREAGRSAAALQGDLAAFVLDHGGPGVEEPAAGLGVAGEHHAAARGQRKHVAGQGPVLVIGHLDQRDRKSVV